ncbi:MAG: family 10 glycosylhydrolase, partial [Candidatus Aenigmarchaeota archaeon]|nr:family 10 glycosylhydrolase [Candidatus Aenigmarchaeota archaeon]
MKTKLLAALLIIALVAVSAWGFSSMQTQEMPERIKMATMWIDDRTERGVREMVREINSSGANAIAFGVHDSGVMFFNSSAIDLRVIDLAPAIIDEAREHDLKVFAWTDTINFPELIEEYSDWEFVTCVRSGRYHYPSDCGWHQRLSPFSPGIDDFVREYYRDIARLDIDGIQFQDDLFLAEGEDFSDAAQHAFLDHYGHPPDTRDPDDIKRMQQLKIAKITELTGIAIESAKEVNPDLIFVFDVLPEAERERMLSWWSIDLQGLRNAGVDYFGIMSYHRQIMQDMRVDIEGSMDYLDSVFQGISGQVGR